jgi:hypothetical protein
MRYVAEWIGKPEMGVRRRVRVDVHVESDVPLVAFDVSRFSRC